MSEIKVDPKTVETLTQIFSKSLIEAKKLGINWNLAEVATAYFHTMDRVLRAIETQKNVTKTKST